MLYILQKIILYGEKGGRRGIYIPDLRYMIPKCPYLPGVFKGFSGLWAFPGLGVYKLTTSIKSHISCDLEGSPDLQLMRLVGLCIFNRFGMLLEVVMVSRHLYGVINDLRSWHHGFLGSSQHLSNGFEGP